MHSALKFSQVFGTTSARSSITIRPTGVPPTVLSKKTLGRAMPAMTRPRSGFPKKYIKRAAVWLLRRRRCYRARSTFSRQTCCYLFLVAGLSGWGCSTKLTGARLGGVNLEHQHHLRVENKETRRINKNAQTPIRTASASDAASGTRGGLRAAARHLTGGVPGGAPSWRSLRSWQRGASDIDSALQSGPLRTTHTSTKVS